MTSRLDTRGMEHRPVFSWHRTHDGLIYTSGHAAVDVDGLDIRPGDFRHECRMTLDNLRRTLERAGSSLAKVVKITAYITDMSDFPAFNQIYGEYFPGDAPPARTCVEVKRLPYNFKVEIEAIATT
jgi:2-iminobutanoate/2-iminopropanoate deaminase